MTTAMACPHCGARELKANVGLQEAEFYVFAVLFLCLMVPGILYWSDRTSQLWCTSCHKRVPNRKEVIR